MRKNDLIGGLIVVAVSAYLFNESRAFPGDSGRLPQLLTGGAIVLGAILIVSSLRPVAAVEGAGFLQSVNLTNLVGSVVLAAAYVALVDRVGYYITTPAYLLAGMLLLGMRNIFTLVGVTAGFAAIVYGIFSVFLHVPLPLGPLFG